MSLPVIIENLFSSPALVLVASLITGRAAKTILVCTTPLRVCITEIRDRESAASESPKEYVILAHAQA